MKKYIRPLLRDLEPVEDPTIVFGGSQGTSGDVSIFSWDSEIDPVDIDMFWASFDETDLAGIDINGDLFISKDEFYTWYNENNPW